MQELTICQPPQRMMVDQAIVAWLDMRNVSIAPALPSPTS
jgi:hypothetical protein